MISDSIIFCAGGNSEQMATIVTGLTTISTLYRHLFFGTNLPWPHEVFIEVLALRGEVCQQVNGIIDMTEVQSIRIFYVNFFWHRIPFIKDLLCRFDSWESGFFFFFFAQEMCLMSFNFLYWNFMSFHVKQVLTWLTSIYMSACRSIMRNYPVMLWIMI